MNSELHLERKTGKELIEICKNMKIKGYSKKNKKELIRLINNSRVNGNLDGIFGIIHPEENTNINTNINTDIDSNIILNKKQVKKCNDIVNSTNQIITLTAGDSAENHTRMEQIGQKRMAGEGYTIEELEEICNRMRNNGHVCELINLSPQKISHWMKKNMNDF